MTNEEFKRAMNRTSKFNSRENAMSFRDRAIKASDIILGDDGKFWVAPIGICASLFRAGYEYAK